MSWIGSYFAFLKTLHRLLNDAQGRQDIHRRSICREVAIDLAMPYPPRTDLERAKQSRSIVALSDGLLGALDSIVIAMLPYRHRARDGILRS